MEHTNRTIRPLTQQDLEAYLDTLWWVSSSP